MSTPSQSFYSAGGRCCDGRSPVPFYVLITPFGGDNRTAMREYLRSQGVDADEPWCHSCATVLENIRDGFSAGGATFLRLVATVAAFVPGIGTGIAVALSGAAALAEGKHITEALKEAALGAVPAGSVIEPAAAAGYAIVEGKGLDAAGLAAARVLAVRTFGEVGGTAFDTVTAVMQGAALQDAGFAALRSMVPGVDLVEQAAGFADAIGRAAKTGQPVEALLLDELAAEVRASAGSRARYVLAPVIAAVQADGSTRFMPSSAFAFALNVPEPIARAARIIVRPNGTIDADMLDRLAPSTVATAIEKYGAAVVASATINQTYAATKDTSRESLLMSALRLSPRSLSYATAKAEQAPAVLPGPVTIVAAPPRAPSRSTTGQDVLLGVTVAGALGALYLWATRGSAT